MSFQAGTVEELVHYKKAVLGDIRRDSRIRSDIEATLGFFSNDSSTAPLNYDSRSTNYENHRPPLSKHRRTPTGLENTMSYTQTSRPLPDYSPSDFYDRNDMEKDLKDFKNVDIEVKAIAHHDKHEIPAGPFTFKERLEHFTFAWYAWTMSTGGVAFTLSAIPFRFAGLTGLGTGMFIMNIGFFTFVTTCLIMRFIIYPGTLTSALANPHEGFFFATFWLTIATMITNTTAYGIPMSGPWLITALRYAFWIYTICATVLAVAYYHVLFTVKKLVITNVLPGWVLPIFPAMLVGTLAAAIAKTQPAEHAMTMLVCGLTFQGLGFFVSLFMYPLYFGRLLTSGLPIYLSRPAMFIAVGPPAFTALAFIGMAQDVQATKIFENFPLNGISNQALIPDILSLLAILLAIFLWMLAFWFFSIAIIAMIDGIPHNDFHLNWYAKVFPNVGFTAATLKIGERLSSPIIQQVGTGMAAILFFAWIFIFFCHIKAYCGKMIAWEGRDEDAH